MATQKTYLNWNNDSIIWGFNDYTWNEVAIVIQISDSFSGGGGLGMVLTQKQPWEDVEKELDDKKFTKEDKETFLRVVAKVNGLISKDEKKINDAIKTSITINHIKKTFTNFGQKIEVKVKNIK